MFWKIELATSAGYYIVLEGIYSTKEGAEAVISRDPLADRMRATRYVRGKYIGAERCEEG
jgi:hypothetical protein